MTVDVNEEAKAEAINELWDSMDAAWDAVVDARKTLQEEALFAAAVAIAVTLPEGEERDLRLDGMNEYRLRRGLALPNGEALVPPLA